MDRLHLLPCALAALAVVLGGAGVSAEEFDPQKLPAPVQETVSFAKHVYPILHARCFKCHQGSDASSEIRLDIRAELLGQGEGDAYVVNGKSGQSRLIELVSGQLEFEVMPPEGERLSQREVAVLRAWIDQGVKWDNELLPPPEAARQHWAFQPPQRPEIPHVEPSDWVRTPVDAFIARAHAKHKLTPAPEASRETLLRRLSLDLIGLPPGPDELDRFVRDKSPDAYAKLIDRLLASPHYGERWGRHWLDVARWAETEGYESNHPRPYAWRYRDYVVQSFREDKPYDRFLLEQLAGDEIEPYADEHLIATGFLAAARLSSNEEDKALQRNDVLVDIVNATGNAVLGLTFNCAQCHDHKFDPITQRDYYSLQAFFVRGQVNNLVLQDPALWDEFNSKKPAGYDAAVKLRRELFEGARMDLIREASKELDPAMHAALMKPERQRNAQERELARQADLKFQFTPGRIEKEIAQEDRKLYNELKKRIDAWKKQMPDKPQVWGFASPAGPHELEVLPMKGFYPLPYEPDDLQETDAYVLIRGDVHQRGDKVGPRWASLFGGEPDPQVASHKPRTALVKWLTDPQNPLTARVWVNRIWHYHFGRGLVETPNDFGVKGARPSHPELLDWLATELIRSGWSTKHIHRLILRSSTYRQASAFTAQANAQRDPDNRYLWRFEPRRLEAEIIRDCILAASGELDRKAGGPSVPAEKSDQALRRGLYLYQKRDAFPEMQTLFDGPTANESCARRHVSTVALQPLYLLNNEFMLERAETFARRVYRLAGPRTEKQIEVAFRLALARRPDDRERRAAREFLRAAQLVDNAPPPQAAPEEAEETNSTTTDIASSDESFTPPKKLVHFCHAILNLNEFVYLE